MRQKNGTCSAFNGDKDLRLHNIKYNPPFLIRNGHFQTIYPSLFRKINGHFYRRERITTMDDDFLDLDWAIIGSETLVIISHGLEGNSHRAYVKGMAKAMNLGGMDALAWNYRGCSGVPNKQLRSYHNGATEDLAQVIQHATHTKRYQKIYLVGFSLGGNLTLVYLGRDRVDAMVEKAVVFSVPCDLKGSAGMLEKTENKIYMARFLKYLHQKIKDKIALFPGKIDDRGFFEIKNFKQFDDRYTAPIHGFIDAEDYWHQCSSKQFIADITTQTLIVNALNDPFLSPSCFPVDEVAHTPHVHLATPQSGGHVGFMNLKKSNIYWSEELALDFFLKGQKT